MLEARGVEVSEAERERILGCVDTELLGSWLDRVLSATSTADVLED